MERAAATRSGKSFPLAAPILPVPHNFGELWAIAGFPMFPSLRSHFTRCCCESAAQGGDSELVSLGSEELGECRCSSAVRDTSKHLMDISLAAEHYVLLIMNAIDLRANGNLSPAQTKESVASELSELEDIVSTLKTRMDQLPSTLASAVARFWGVFDAVLAIAFEALLAPEMQSSTLNPAISEFGGEVTLWLHLMHAAQIEAGHCAPQGVGQLPSGRAVLAPGLGLSNTQVLLQLLRSISASRVEPDGSGHGSLRAVEIGTREGKLAEALLRAEPRLELMVVDAWGMHARADNVSDFSIAAHTDASWQRLTKYRPRVLLTSDSIAASKWVADGTLDLVFLDGDHSYDGVKADLLAWAPKLKRGGILSGHDYNSDFPEVVQAVREFLASALDGKNMRLWAASDSTWFTILENPEWH